MGHGSGARSEFGRVVPDRKGAVQRQIRVFQHSNLVWSHKLATGPAPALVVWSQSCAPNADSCLSFTGAVGWSCSAAARGRVGAGSEAYLDR